MKSIKTATLAIFSASLLTMASAHAAPTTSDDGFLVLTVEEAPAAATPRSQKQAQRSTRTERTTRAKRATTTKKSSSKPRYYRVRSGDTLTRISVKTGVRFSKLVRLNRLHGSKKDRINAGQRLRLR
ncbi:LysM domain-containing protein [Leucothrix sargassi]|nr:LysM domain-containing protein [Leucothrix sargassi]